jgi:hypothetical protein
LRRAMAWPWPLASALWRTWRHFIMAALWQSEGLARPSVVLALHAGLPPPVLILDKTGD